jgi:ABC-type Mn2+/Zn2+ transport system permease subunit/Mn-dependent DtxR family transcriptional regulator
MSILDILNEVWAVRALIASSLVGIMCGILGAFIVLRNMSLIGDALSHAILPGVVVAFILFGYTSLGFFVGAVLAGLIAAVAITWIQENIKTKNDAAIGIVFTAMFSIGVIGISRVSKTDGVHLDLKDFLFGNILGVSDQDLIMTAVVAFFVVASIFIFYRYLFISTFQPVIARTMGISVGAIHYFLMLLLSFSVVASLQTVGVILVVAMLITPASTALLLSNKLKNVLWISGLIGLISAVAGLYFAIIWDTTPGPAMAVCATIIYLLTAVFAPKRGLLSRFFMRQSHKAKIVREDVLKQAFKLNIQKNLDFDQLKNKLDMSKRRLHKHLQTLAAKKWVRVNKDNIELTKLGKDHANQLVRAHRLWESYLVQQMGLSEEQIHEDAERFEHLLTEELVDEVDAALGYPWLDPHGSPIPAKEVKPSLSLSELGIDDKAHIANRQIGEEVTHELWKLGLIPSLAFYVKRKENGFLILDVKGKETKIPESLAERITVAIP